jgi:putative aldouronate transport system substrate-binding protein
MKRRILRTLTLLIAAFLVIMLVACATTPSSTGTAATTTASSNTPGVLTFMTPEFVNAPLTVDDLVMTQIQKATNVTITLQVVPAADFKTKIDALVAAKQLPDMFCVGNILPQYSSQGVFAKLNDWIAKSDTFQKILAQFPFLTKNMKDDNGDYFFIPRMSELPWWTNEMINQDLLDKTGMSAPTNLTELETVLKAFKATGSDVIPWECSPWMGNSFGDPALHAFGISQGWYDYGNNKYEYGPYDEKGSYYQYLVYMNKLWSEGLIDTSAYSISDDDIVAKLKTNKVGFMYGWADGFSLWGKDGSYSTNFVPMAALAGPDGKSHSVVSQFMDGNVCYISASSKNIDSAERVLDYIYSDEGCILLNWGIEGQTYTETNGKKTFMDVVAKDQMPMNKARTFGVLHPSIPYLDTLTALASLVGPLTAEYVDLCKNNAFPQQPFLSGTTSEQAELSGITTDIDKFVSEESAKFITGATAINEQSFATFISTLESMNIKQAETLYNAQYQRWANRK